MSGLIIGLDPAAFKCGVAIADLVTEEFLEWKKIEFSTRKFKDMTDVQRADAVINDVLWILDQKKPSVVRADDLRITFGNTQGFQDYYSKKNLGLLERYCQQHGIDLQFVSSTSMRAAILTKEEKAETKRLAEEEAERRGGGRKPKPDWKKAVIKHFEAKGIPVGNEDEADACGFAEYEFVKRRSPKRK